MIQFYEKKDFSSLISDTLKFFKLYGKNFFKNFIILNGVFFILILILFFIGLEGIFSQLINEILGGETYFFEKYLQDNYEVLFIRGIIFIILHVVLIFIISSYPVLYMKRIAENPQQIITSDQILIDFKNFIKKFIIYILGMIFIMLPLTIFSFLVSSVLFIFGIFIMSLLFPVLFNIAYFTLFHQYNTSNGFFSSLSYAFRSQFSYSDASLRSPFWKYWGSTIVMYLLTTIITYIFTFIPIIILSVIIFTVPLEGIHPNQIFSSGYMITITIIYGMCLIASLFLMNLLYVNTGLCYYDSRIDLQRNLKLQEIDSIGKSEI